MNVASKNSISSKVSVYKAKNCAQPFITYDVNGNMTQDKNKGIQSITYNYLNLPILVDFGNGSKIEWVYTVSGVKLEKRVYTNGTLTLTQDYISGFVYKNTGSGSALEFFSTEAGRVKRKTNGSLRYEYTLADHLGNARVTFTDDDVNNAANGVADVLEYSAYYAPMVCGSKDSLHPIRTINSRTTGKNSRMIWG